MRSLASPLVQSIALRLAFFCGLVLLWWSFGLDFGLPQRYPRASRAPSRPRLARYLNE